MIVSHPVFRLALLVIMLIKSKEKGTIQYFLKTVTCPEEQLDKNNTIFLAGGISNCPDWQTELIKMMSHLRLTTLNPRRESFDINDPKATDFQIAWEHRHLNLAEAISFWFPKETECPITLFELGYWLLSDKPLVIGAHDEYPRLQELMTHLVVYRPELKLHNSLRGLANGIENLSEKQTNSFIKAEIDNNDIFLAGGISGCSDWQSNASHLLNQKGITVFNPRQLDFNGKGGIGYRGHLRKNHQKLIDSRAILFWFPKESLNSIALFELGIACQLNKPLFIGVEPGYCRTQDVIVQTELARPEIKVVSSLQELIGQISK